MASFIASLDVGTSSCRCYILASDTVEVITFHQLEYKLDFPKHGWVEQDAQEVLDKAMECIEQACEKLIQLGHSPKQIKALGITNQRETLVIWSKATGKPIRPAIVWSDNRTTNLVEEIKETLPGGKDDVIRFKTGLSLNPYFTGPKFLWLMKNDDEVNASILNKECLVGTVDSWILYGLTGKHCTDVSNASRTLFMNINTLKYDEHLLEIFNVPEDVLPEIRSSSEIYGYITKGHLKGVPVSGMLGDQQSSLFGHMAFQPGQCKTTYGTGCFLLCNIGEKPIYSEEGLLTTVAYQLGPNARASYAFEGAVAVAGAGITWLKDNLKIANTPAEIEKLASEVEDSDCAFVPSFSGLYCPYWEPKAHGIISGLSYSITYKHLARAALEAVCLHVAEIREIISREAGFPIDPMFVDGGMCQSNLLMQMQCDIAGMSVVRPLMLEVTALGAAFVAGLAEGIEMFTMKNGVITNASQDACDTFTPKSTIEYQMRRQRHWKQAIRKCLLDVETANVQGVKKQVDVNAASFYPFQWFCMASIGLFALAEAMSS